MLQSTWAMAGRAIQPIAGKAFKHIFPKTVQLMFFLKKKGYPAQGQPMLQQRLPSLIQARAIQPLV